MAPKKGMVPRRKKKKPVTRETAVNRYSHGDHLMIVGGPLQKEWWFAEFQDYNWNDCKTARCILCCHKSNGEEDANQIITVMLEDLVPIDYSVVEPSTQRMKFGNSVLKMSDFKWC